MMVPICFTADISSDCEWVYSDGMLIASSSVIADWSAQDHMVVCSRLITINTFLVAPLLLTSAH